MMARSSLQAMIPILLAVGVTGCGMLNTSQETGTSASASPAAPASFATVTAAPLEFELSSHLQRGQTAEETLRLVLDAYSHVPLEPILRIETQAHLRAIHALALSPRGDLLATASVDRTIRLWDTRQGMLLATLRAPSGRHGAGTPYALAFSPDGKTLATAGLSFFSQPTDQLRQASFLIHFFDTERHTISKTLEGIPGRVHHLAYSRNGRYLAVAYGADNVHELGPQRIIGNSGVRIYDAKSLALLRETATESPCQWVEFDNAQQLHALCQRVILQYAGLELSRIRESEGAVFHYAALSPDTRMLAVSHRDDLRIDLLDTADLALQRTLNADTPMGKTRAFHSLIPVWSQGGSYLYAAGQRADAQQAGNRLFQWRIEGSDLATTSELAPLDLLALLPGRDGLIYLGTSAASVLALDSQGHITTAIASTTVDADNRPGELRVSADGRTVAYSDDLAGRRRFVFSLDRRTLLPWDDAANTSDLHAAVTEAPPDVRNWRIGREPTCAGKPLDLGGGIAQNLAINPHGQDFVIGTETGVIYFDRNCRKQWETSNQARSIAVAIADAAGLALTQDEAGVIRWLRLSDGKKLLSFFPSLNGRSWTAWTPLGHYDASPEGEALVGWHINRDRYHEALFYGAGRFRDLFHKPDEITRSLTLDDAMARDARIGQALALGQQMRKRMPPQVRISKVSEKTDKLGLKAQVDFTMSVPNGDTSVRVRALVNGRPAGTAQDVSLTTDAEEYSGQMQVPLPPDAEELALIAESSGHAGEPARFPLRDGEMDSSATAESRPRLYALVIGIAKYRSSKVPQLDFPGKDARDFARMLQTQSGSLYRNVEVRLLADNQATREHIIDGMDWLRREVTANDIAVVFLAGHGVNDNLSQYFFLPHDADIDRLRSTAISNNDIVDSLQALPSKVLAFLDTCHSGNVMGITSKKRALGDINRLVNELTSAENGVIVFASSTGLETSLESPDWNNGAFTKALVEGLDGHGDYNHDGVISLNELNLWVADRVKALSRGEQHANMIRPDSIRDFPFALARKRP